MNRVTAAEPASDQDPRTMDRAHLMITVVAHIRAKPGFEQQVKASLLGLIPPTVQEQGCIRYDLHQDLRDPCRFVFHEHWACEDDLDRHLASPHLRRWPAETEGWLAAPVEIYRLQKVDSPSKP